MEHLTGLFSSQKKEAELIPLIEKKEERESAVSEISKALLEAPLFNQKELKRVLEERTYGVPSTILEAQTAEIFNFLKENCLPELYSLISQMPKGANLDLHFEGAIYAEEWGKLSAKKELYWDFEKKRMSKGATEHSVQAQKLFFWPEFYSDFKNAVTWKKTGSIAEEDALKLKKCLEIVRHLSPLFDPHKLVKRIVEQSIQEGVDYLEISINPSVLSNPEEFFLNQKKIEYHEVTVAFVIEVNRVEIDNKKFREDVIQAFKLIREHKNVVAMTLGGAEHDPIALENFSAQIQIIEELYFKEPKVRIKLPVGELNLELVEKKAMLNRINQAINRGHAERITYGNSIVHEKSWDSVCYRMKKIALELCPTWHRDFLNSSGREHPVKMFQKYDVPIVFGSERPGITRKDLTDQFYEAATSLGFSYLALKKAARDSLKYAFIKDEEGNYDRHSIFEDGKLLESFKGVDQPGWSGSYSEFFISEMSPRVKMQVKLEQAFVAFEKKLIEQYDSKNVFSHLHEQHQILQQGVSKEE